MIDINVKRRVAELEEILKEHQMYRNGVEGARRADLSNMDLRGYVFKNISMSEVIFDNANLEGAVFENVALVDVSMVNVDLSYARFNNCVIGFTSITGKVKSTVFSESDLNNVKMMVEHKDEVILTKSSTAFELSFNS